MDYHICTHEIRKEAENNEGQVEHLAKNTTKAKTGSDVKKS